MKLFIAVLKQIPSQVVFLTICLTIFAANAQVKPSHFDSSEQHYIYYDNNYNVVQRLRTEKKAEASTMSDEDKKPVSILIYEADFVTIQRSVQLSQFVEAVDLDKVKSADGKIFIPCLESDKISTIALQLKFGKPKYKTTGHKVLSRATYYIDPVGPTGGFFAKFVPHIPGLEQKVAREILVNDYLKSQLQFLPADMREQSMDSFMGVNLSLLGIPISVAYRSAERILNKPDNVRVYPGHGLLGCIECVEEYAMKWSGLSDPKKAVAMWKQQEFLPKLARYTAYSHHVLGLSLESHTQNMVIDIDNNTGEIIKFYFRDYADVLLNPIALLGDGRMPTDIEWARVKLLSVHTNYFSDQAVGVAKDIWYHASIYSGQGITSHVEGFQRQQRYMLTFLKAYILNVEDILGEKVPLDQAAMKVLETLEEAPKKADFQIEGELQDRSKLRNAMASVLKPIFEFSHEVQSKKIELALRDAIQSHDQEKLKKSFFKDLTLQRVVFMGLDQREVLKGPDQKSSWLKATLQAYFKLGLNRRNIPVDLEFKILDDRVWAIDKVTQKPLAASIEKFQDVGNWLDKVPFFNLLFKSSKSAEPSMIQRCESLFGGGK